MANTVTTPNMSLELPIPSVQTGPDYADNLNAALTLVDEHTHIPGQGLPVPAAGLNIDADLAFNSNNAITLRSSRYDNQSSTLSAVTDLCCVYASGGELYFRDASGNNVKITVSGAVNSSGSGNISGMGSTTAAVTYSSISSTFSFTSDTSTPAKMNVGPLVIGRNTASPFTVTLSPHASQGANYNLTFPQALPASTSIVTLDTSGQLTGSYTVDNSTLEISSNVIRAKDAGITTAKLADGAVTQAKRAALGQISSTVASFTTTSTSYVDAGFSTTITTTGRPVYVALQPVTTSGSSVSVSSATSGAGGFAAIYLDGSILVSQNYSSTNSGTFAAGAFPGFSYIDAPAAGSHTYKVYLKSTFSATTTAVTNMRLIAYEL